MAYIRITAVSEIPAGTGKTFTISDQPVAVFNIDGTFYAIADTCSHADASLGEGELDSDEITVECPLHGSLFDLKSGKPRTLPAYEPVATYAVKVEDDSVFVNYFT